MKINTSFFQKLFLALLFTFFLENISAQIFGVDGTIMARFQEKGHESAPYVRDVVVTTNISMYEILYQYYDPKLLYTTEKGIEIIRTVRKYNRFDFSDHYLILLSNGHIIDYSIQTHTFREIYNNSLPAGTENFLDFQGDDLYVLSQGIYIYSSSIYKSSNNGQNFFIDTIGLNNATLRNMTLDTFQNVYLATSNGLFSQTLIGNNWIKNTHLPVAAANCSVVFADRRNRIFVYGGDNKLYKSLDLGSSFTIDTAGIGTKKVISIADDSVGNIYLVVNSHLGFRTGDRLYRSDVDSTFCPDRYAHYSFKC